MSGIKNLILDTDESVLWTRKPESGPIMAVGFMWTVFFIGIIMTIYQYVNVPSAVIVATLVGFTVISFVHFWFASTQTRYIITNKRLFVYDGGIRPVTANISREEITNIRVEKGRSESALNTGRIVFETEDNRLLTLSSLPQAESLANKLVKHMPNADVNNSEDATFQAKGVTWPRSFAED